MKNRKIITVVVYLLILTVALSWLAGVFDTTGNSIPYSRVVELFEGEQVQSFVVQGDQITMYLYNPYNGKTTVSTTLADPDGFRQEMSAPDCFGK